MTLLLMGLGAPLLLGCVAVWAVGPRRLNVVERLALAWLLGAALLSTTMILLGRAGLSLTRTGVGATLAFVVVALVVAGCVRLSRTRPQPVGISDNSSSHAGLRFASPLVARFILRPLLVLLLTMRIVWVVADAAIVPERMTDAYENWFLRAKVISELGRVPLDPDDPYYLGGGRVSYPLGMPMLAVWPALLRGGWDETTAHLVWPVYYLALLALIGGWAARRFGADIGLLAAYLLSSVPIIGVHAVRGGYADLLLSAHLAAACLAAWQATESNQRRAWRAVMLGNLLFCVLLKREGLPYCVLLALVGAYQRNGPPLARRAASTLAVVVVAWLLARTADMSYVAPELSGINWHPESMAAIRQRLFTWDTWNLLWWLLAPAEVIATVRLARRRQWLPALHALVLSGFVFGVFVLTDNAAFAVNGWTFDRTAMHIAPALLAMALFGLARPGDSQHRVARSSDGCPARHE